LAGKQYPAVEGVKAVTEQCALTNSNAKTGALDFIGARFVEESDVSGRLTICADGRNKGLVIRARRSCS